MRDIDKKITEHQMAYYYGWKILWNNQIKIGRLRQSVIAIQLFYVMHCNRIKCTWCYATHYMHLLVWISLYTSLSVFFVYFKLLKYCWNSWETDNWQTLPHIELLSQQKILSPLLPFGTPRTTDVSLHLSRLFNPSRINSMHTLDD